MSCHSDTQTSEIEDEYMAEINQNPYVLSNLGQPLRHISPLLSPNARQNRPLLIPPFMLPPAGLPPPPLFAPPPVSEGPRPDVKPLIMPPFPPLISPPKLPSISEPLITPNEPIFDSKTAPLFHPPPNPLDTQREPLFTPPNMPLLMRPPNPIPQQNFPPVGTPKEQFLPQFITSQQNEPTPVPFFQPPNVSQHEPPREPLMRLPVPQFTLPDMSQHEPPREPLMRHPVPQFPLPDMSQHEPPREPLMRHPVPQFPLPDMSQHEPSREPLMRPPVPHFQPADVSQHERPLMRPPMPHLQPLMPHFQSPDASQHEPSQQPLMRPLDVSNHEPPREPLMRPPVHHFPPSGPPPLGDLLFKPSVSLAPDQKFPPTPFPPFPPPQVAEAPPGQHFTPQLMNESPQEHQNRGDKTDATLEPHRSGSESSPLTPQPANMPPEMWRPLSSPTPAQSEVLRFPHPPQFPPPIPHFDSPPVLITNPQDRKPTQEPSQAASDTIPAISEPSTNQPVVSQPHLHQNVPGSDTFSHLSPEEMDYDPEMDVPGPHYHSTPHHRQFPRPHFQPQRPYGPPRDQFYPPYPMHAMRYPRPPHGPMGYRPLYTEHVTMDGRVYYHNHDTLQSFWEPPPDFDRPPAPPTAPQFDPQRSFDEMEAKNESETEPLEDTISRPPVTKPVQSTSVPGTGWCVVWTNDDKVFFFNAVINKSVWQIPPEIKDNPVAIKLMERNPDLVVEPAESDTPAKRVKIMDEQEVDLKEVASDGGDSDEQVEEGVEIILQQSLKVKLPKKVKNVGSELGINESEAKIIRASKPLEDRTREYKKMLLDRGVSAFSTWEKEQHKVAFDPRYILFTAKERKIVFEQFSQERIHDEKREKNIQIKLRKERFFSLLEEAKVGAKSSFHDFNLKWSKDSRFKEIEKIRERENLFLEYQSLLKKKSKSQNKQHAIETTVKESRHDHNSKRDRVEASLREREREVFESRRTQERAIEDQRSLHKRDEAKAKYKSVLNETVKDSKASFRTFEKELKLNSEFDEFFYNLSRSERENYFEHHLDHLQNKKCTQYQACIDECLQINISTPFKKARRYIKHDPRFEALSSSETRREAEYTKHLQTKLKHVKDEFCQLLRETKLINYKTKPNLDSNPKCLLEIEDILKNDLRYLNLDCLKEQRTDVLLEYIDELSQKGAPPPPTASSPNRSRI